MSNHCHCCSCNKHNEHNKKEIISLTISGLSLAVELLLSFFDMGILKKDIICLVYNLIAFLPVGLPVIKKAIEESIKGNIFSEFTLMSIAAIGAFFIGEYPEAVAVMWLYALGELLQYKAVGKARNQIKSLINLKVEKVKRIGDDNYTGVKDIAIGDIIEVLPGDRIALDGIIVSKKGASLNTSALTGESVPRYIESGSEVLAGMLATDEVIHIKVTRTLKESAISRILKMVEDAAERKAPTELFIRKFAKIYTPIIFLIAIILNIAPYAYSLLNPTFNYIYSDWLYLSLMLLVISCPCALVISVPLAYFAGIGTASKKGILFKGSNYLDAIKNLDTIAFDKTGTLTKGEFNVDKIIGLNDKDLAVVIAMEKTSTHPIAKAIYNLNCKKEYQTKDIELSVKNISGFGLTANVVNNYTKETSAYIAGTLRLLKRENISYPKDLENIPDTIIVCAKNKEYLGYILLSDTIKPDTAETLKTLHSLGIQNLVMLSGDKQALVSKVAEKIGIDQAKGDLLPADKAQYISNLKGKGHKTAFVGDGINDAPVLALSDVGIAMGALGSDVAIETADIVLQTDKIANIADAIKIAKRTHNITLQNITFAIGIKILFIILGIFGIATMWMAIFADTGIALLAILNTLRVKRK